MEHLRKFNLVVPLKKSITISEKSLFQKLPTPDIFQASSFVDLRYVSDEQIPVQNQR